MLTLILHYLAIFLSADGNSTIENIPISKMRESETFRFMYFSFRFLVSRIIRGKVPLDSCFDLYKTTEIEVFIHGFRFKHWFKQMREKPPKSAENDTKKAVI